MITIFNAVSLLSVVHKIFSLSIELKYYYLVVVDEDSFNPFALVETYVSRQYQGYTDAKITINQINEEESH